VHTVNFGELIIAKNMKNLFSNENVKVIHADYTFNPEYFCEESSLFKSLMRCLKKLVKAML